MTLEMNMGVSIAPASLSGKHYYCFVFLHDFLGLSLQALHSLRKDDNTIAPKTLNSQIVPMFCEEINCKTVNL
jgi:hypothetical protein